MKAVILDQASLSPSDLVLSGLWELPLQWQTYETTLTSEIADRLTDAVVVCTNKVTLTRQLMCQHSTLKLIIVMATGTNNVDLEAARSLGIKVCNIVDYSTPSVVQHTFALILALATRLLDYCQDVDNGQWQKSPFFGLLDYQVQELAGKILGIVGYGAIGQGVASVAQDFGMQVLVAKSLVDNSVARSEINSAPRHTTEIDRVEFKELLPLVDVLSIHCPLSAESSLLIDAQALALLKPSALLVNVSRGGIVDEQALAACLDRQGIAGAALDVLSVEPPGLDSILLQRKYPNLIVTPHSAWASQQSRQRLIDQVVSILKLFVADEPLINNIV